MTTFRVRLFIPKSFQKLNSIEIREAAGIEDELIFGTKEGLVEKLPERKSDLDGFWIHLKKM